MHEALSWLLQHYAEVKLWMGVETEEGAELYLTCSPAQSSVVEALEVYEDDPSIFEQVTGIHRACVNE